VRSKTNPAAIEAMAIAPRTRPSNYPAPFAQRMSGREKRALGDFFGLNSLGVNLTRLAPGAQSALLHRHSAQEEFVYILSGTPTLISNADEVPLSPGMCAGFTPQGSAHYLRNQSDQEVVYLEIGTRVAGDAVVYPADDLQAVDMGDGKWGFTHKDGMPY
jgi:uncharacterized cupin superfamily protein